jgi:phosphoribosylformylglycinamidine synthase
MAECAFDTYGMGAEISIDAVDAASDASLSLAAALFGESASRVVISAAPEHATAVLQRAAAAGVPARVVGRTGGTRLSIKVAGTLAVDLPIDEAERAWASAIDRCFEKRVA